jgi:hypothetical protein
MKVHSCTLTSFLVFAAIDSCVRNIAKVQTKTAYAHLCQNSLAHPWLLHGQWRRNCANRWVMSCWHPVSWSTCHTQSADPLVTHSQLIHLSHTVSWSTCHIQSADPLVTHSQLIHLSHTVSWSTCHTQFSRSTCHTQSADPLVTHCQLIHLPHTVSWSTCHPRPRLPSAFAQVPCQVAIPPEANRQG